jgi:hypothetical protein
MLRLALYGNLKPEKFPEAAGSIQQARTRSLSDVAKAALFVARHQDLLRAFPM